MTAAFLPVELGPDLLRGPGVIREPFSGNENGLEFAKILAYPAANIGWMERFLCPAKPVLKDAFSQSLLLERSKGRKRCGGTRLKN